MKKYKNNFESEYLPNPFLSYKFMWENMTIYGKFVETLKWTFALFQTFIIILLVLFILFVMFGGINSVMGI